MATDDERARRVQKLVDELDFDETPENPDGDSLQEQFPTRLPQLIDDIIAIIAGDE